jgi:hypothetical protein
MKLNALICCPFFLSVLAGCGGAGSSNANNGNVAVASPSATDNTAAAQQLKPPVLHCAPTITATTAGPDALHAKADAKACPK